MINKNHTEILAQTKMQSLPGELRRLMTSFEEVQEQVLLDILRYSENTEFGIANGFAQIKNPEEYRRKFPITEYKDYKEAVVRMENGVLCGYHRHYRSFQEHTRKRRRSKGKGNRRKTPHGRDSAYGAPYTDART